MTASRAARAISPIRSLQASTCGSSRTLRTTSKSSSGIRQLEEVGDLESAAPLPDEFGNARTDMSVAANDCHLVSMPRQGASELPMASADVKHRGAGPGREHAQDGLLLDAEKPLADRAGEPPGIVLRRRLHVGQGGYGGHRLGSCVGLHVPVGERADSRGCGTTARCAKAFRMIDLRRIPEQPLRLLAGPCPTVREEFHPPPVDGRIDPQRHAHQLAERAGCVERPHRQVPARRANAECVSDQLDQRVQRHA